MINHVRTLLRNETAPATYEADDEYVDPTYTPVPLSDPLRAVRDRLFGIGVDRYGVNVTLARIWAAIDTHPTLAAVARVADTRVALSPPAPPPAPLATGTTLASIVTAPHPFAADGRGYGSWLVEVVGGAATITTPGGSPVTGTVETVSGRHHILLPGSSAYLDTPVSDGVWLARLWATPTHEFTDLLEGDPDVLFAPGIDALESDLLDVWRYGQFDWERAAAGAIGLSRRIDALRIS